ncbi:MAG TPA: hypothetical protein ENN29_10750 [Candidatus Hydrogenedentes bacterium]|nr:hypothetical protein [Candidatus Hydrogenedentota bacterium]
MQKRINPLPVLVVAVGMLSFPFATFAQPLNPPWADAVVSANAIDPVPGFTDPSKALGKPVGGGVYAPDQSSVYSIGRPGPAPGSFITLAFNTPIENHPENPNGLDFIIYTNAFWVGGKPNVRWSEPGLVEISEDVNGNGIPDDSWYVIPGSRNTNRSALPQGIPNPYPPLAGVVTNPNLDGTEYDWGYMGMSPTVQEYLDNYMRPDDPFTVGLTDGSGGGDAFDISWAVDEDGNPANLERIHFVRVNAFINDSLDPFGYVTPEIVAVSAVAPDNDTDGDGIRDAYELRVSGTDPYRSESTVLALERPIEYGGSPAGTLLGDACDPTGNRIVFYSSGIRSGYRDYNCNVDIQVHALAPSGGVPDGLIKSGACREFIAGQPDFQAAQIQDAQFTIAYTTAEIVGLDESKLEPVRFTGTSYTREGVSGITRDMVNNLLTFRSRYPGVFLLISEAGMGDETPGQSAITLLAEPDCATADGISDVTFVSEPIILPDETPAPAGMLFTVTVAPETLATIVTPDADAETPGLQTAAAADSRITFTLRSTTLSGQASVRAASLDEATVGQVAYTFLAGNPVGPVPIYPLNPNATAPGPIHFSTDILYDEHDNVLENDRLITILVDGGRCMNADAAPDTPGHQLRVTQGRAYFSVIADTDVKTTDTAQVRVRLYADAEMTLAIADAVFVFDILAMPMRWLVLCVLLLAMTGAGRLFYACNPCAKRGTP